MSGSGRNWLVIAGVYMIACALVVGACGRSIDAAGEAGLDAGALDGGDGGTDAGTLDGSADAGASDAGGQTDAGADAGSALDAGSDGGTGPDAGTSTQAASGCEVSDLVTLYPGLFPPNPYATAPLAGTCAARHDVLVLLGCPNNADGTAASCQTQRVDLALRLSAAGFGDDFLVTGAAVHNAWVEADTLAGLLVRAGVPPEHIVKEPKAMHTDENIYYATRLMEPRGWKNAIVVSDDPGHLVMTALCDADCCVKLGRLTVLEFPTAGGSIKAGHYVLAPPATLASADECAHIEFVTKAMCTQLKSRLACKDDFKLPLQKPPPRSKEDLPR